MWYPPPNYQVNNLCRLPSHQFDLNALRLRKKLTLLNQNPYFNMKKIFISNNEIRKIAKRPLAKKVLRMEIKPTVFPYYETCFRSSLRWLAFEKHHRLRKHSTSKPKAEIIKPHVGNFKHLKSLIVPETFLFRYIKLAKKLKNLQEFEFSLTEAQVPFVYDLFRNVNRLQRVKLALLRDPQPPINLRDDLMRCRTWLFIKDLLGLQSLTALKLRFQDCRINKEESFLCDFLQLVMKSSLKNFDIEILPIYSEKIEDNNLELKELLSQLTSLRFYLSENSHNFKTYKEIEGDQKRLSLFLSQKGDRDLSQTIDSCSALQELQIHTFNSNLLVSKDSGLSKKLRVIDIKIKDAKDSIALDFMKYLTNGLKDCEIQVFSFELNEIDENNLREFVKIPQGFLPGSSKEFSFKMLGSKPWNLPERNQDNFSLKPLCPEMISIFIQQALISLHSLQVLELSLNLELSISVKSIEPLFDTLVNLRSFDLVIYSLNPTLGNDAKGSVNINLAKMTNLRSFRFQCDNHFVIDNLADFFESIVHLKNIHHLLVLCPTLESIDSNMISVIAQRMAKIETKWEYLYLGSHQNLIRGEMDKFLRS